MSNKEFQPNIYYREVSRSPLVIAKQTFNVLDLINHRLNIDPRPAVDYLHDYTLAYLNAAKIGSGDIYDKAGIMQEDISLEVREASHHAAVIFSVMSDHVQSPFFPAGFSKNGILRGPATHREFLDRIRELQIGISLFATDQIPYLPIMESNFKLFRVFQFFKVGSELPIKLTESEEKQSKIQRKQFNDMLAGIDININ